MILDKYYEIAKEHKDSHKSCGGEPYKSYNKLEEIIKNLGGVRVLEVGTAVGFTTFILHTGGNHTPGKSGGVKMEGNKVDTVELHNDHIEEAKKNILSWGGDLNMIKFMEGDAKDVLPTLDEKYDVIFFDGYGAKLAFYNDFERLLGTGGLLITANKHLKSTEHEYFEQLENTDKWEFVEEFADTKVYRKIM